MAMPPNNFGQDAARLAQQSQQNALRAQQESLRNSELNREAMVRQSQTRRSRRVRSRQARRRVEPTIATNSGPQTGDEEFSTLPDAPRDRQPTGRPSIAEPSRVRGDVDTASRAVRAIPRFAAVLAGLCVVVVDILMGIAGADLVYAAATNQSYRNPTIGAVVAGLAGGVWLGWRLARRLLVPSHGARADLDDSEVQRRGRRVRVRGVARQVYASPLGNDSQLLTLRVERFDADGNRLQPIPVQIKGPRLDGTLSDGDEVELSGRWTRGTVRTRRARNLTTGAELSATLARVKHFVIAVVVLAILIFILVNIYNAATGQHDPQRPSSGATPAAIAAQS
jgi:hypothetical protein